MAQKKSASTKGAKAARAVARRDGDPATSPFDPSIDDGLPAGRDGRLTPWCHGDWLIALVVAQRERLFGVVGVERDDASGFSDEDQEILTLLAQLTATALAATGSRRLLLRH
jgi:hypothetical protein